ncbi:hypothetical protein C8R45DRAFT_385169 [Mycena sanguinolenta]|nr:hypothetical protein C8R45DRAFT_385169 [Mycena sanguinolenta]
MVDCRRGGHRKHCGSNQMLSLAESRNCALGFRERQFMRVLVQHDFRKQTPYTSSTPSSWLPTLMRCSSHSSTTPISQLRSPSIPSQILPSQRLSTKWVQSGRILCRARGAVVDACNCISSRSLTALTHGTGRFHFEQVLPRSQMPCASWR